MNAKIRCGLPNTSRLATVFGVFGLERRYEMTKVYSNLAITTVAFVWLIAMFCVMSILSPEINEVLISFLDWLESFT